MSDTRKLELDIELINKLLPQLETELEVSKRDEEEARTKLHIAEAKHAKALAYVRQMRGEANSRAVTTDDNAERADKDDDSSLQAREAQAMKLEPRTDEIEGRTVDVPSILNERQRGLNISFWEVNGFQWRRFLPELIERENRFMNIVDVLNAMGLTEQQKMKHYPTISSALSVLAKDGEKIIAHTVPGLRGQLYGLSSFLEEDGKVKHEHVDDMLRRRRII